MKHIDNLFKEKLYNHEASVPEGMWEKIAPIAEEESGRALVWFWFAGALALVIGGYGIYKMINANTPADPSTLAFEEQIKDQIPNYSVDNSLTSLDESSLNTTIENSTEEITEIASDELSNESTDTNEPKIATSKKVKKQPKKAEINNNSTSNSRPQNVNNTVESISKVVGVPANLIITKSYINKEGSIIKQSNLTDDSGTEGPIYDIIINSEAKDLNAGALLRIVEPLENIPLPSFQKKLKKKTLTTHF